MSSRLKFVNDWAALAKTAKYCARDLAALRRVSSRQLERFFKREMGCRPHQWLRDERMRRAAELISEGERSLKEIATDELGYESAAHFTRDFKEYFGIPPSHYRPDIPQPPSDT